MRTFGRTAGTAVLVLLNITLVACTESTNNPPLATRSTPSPSATGLTPCEELKSTAFAAEVSVVFFSCGPALRPTPRQISDDATMAQDLVNALIAGPTDTEVAQGFTGVFPDTATRALVARSGSTVVVDLDSSTFAKERFMASSVFTVQAVEKTLEALPGVGRVTLTIDGRSLCDQSDEC